LQRNGFGKKIEIKRKLLLFFHFILKICKEFSLETIISSYKGKNVVVEGAEMSSL